jgi:hypothetical protein
MSLCMMAGSCACSTTIPSAMSLAKEAARDQLISLGV